MVIMFQLHPTTMVGREISKYLLLQPYSGEYGTTFSQVDSAPVYIYTSHLPRAYGLYSHVQWYMHYGMLMSVRMGVQCM